MEGQFTASSCFSMQDPSSNKNKAAETGGQSSQRKDNFYLLLDMVLYIESEYIFAKMATGGILLPRTHIL